MVVSAVSWLFWLDCQEPHQAEYCCGFRVSGKPAVRAFSSRLVCGLGTLVALRALSFLVH